MATQNIPVPGGRASGGSSYTSTAPQTAQASSYEEDLLRDFTSPQGAQAADPTAPFGTQAHFNSLSLSNIGTGEFLRTLTTPADIEIGKATASGNAVQKIWKEPPNDYSGGATLEGYLIGSADGANQGFRIPGQKNARGFYKVDTTGKPQGIDIEDTSWRSALPALTLLLGPLAQGLAPALASSISGATGLGSTAANIAARGLIGGGVSAITGGNIGRGILGGAVAAGVNPAISNIASEIAGQGTTAAAILGGAGRLGVNAALNGGQLSPQAIIGTMIDSLGRGQKQQK